MLAAALPADDLKRIRALPVPSGRWHDYAARFSWEPHVELVGSGDVVWVTGFNGECDWIDLSSQRSVRGSASNSQRAVPQRLELEWTSPAGVRMAGEAELDPTEALPAFAEMSRKAGGTPMHLLVHPADAGDHIEVLLRSGEDVYRFGKVNSLVWSR